ncbi:hypothetical protein [Treponema medium]|uniref:hypothetical protein n=1 Tax=Treponema medium TaxID=58231 RepID=UPI0003A91B6E|nr:hypothetical protein [Treponema medium]
MFAKANSLFGNVQGCTFPNNGVHAASEDPQRIRTDRDVRGANQQRVCAANT